MDQRVSVITLGVADVGRSQAFYESLGWHLDDGIDDDNDHIAFFQAPGMIVSLWYNPHWTVHDDGSTTLDA